MPTLYDAIDRDLDLHLLAAAALLIDCRDRERAIVDVEDCESFSQIEKKNVDVLNLAMMRTQVEFEAVTTVLSCALFACRLSGGADPEPASEHAGRSGGSGCRSRLSLPVCL